MTTPRIVQKTFPTPLKAGRAYEIDEPPILSSTDSESRLWHRVTYRVTAVDPQGWWNITKVASRPLKGHLCPTCDGHGILLGEQQRGFL